MRDPHKGSSQSLQRRVLDVGSWTSRIHLRGLSRSLRRKSVWQGRCPRRREGAELPSGAGCACRRSARHRRIEGKVPGANLVDSTGETPPAGSQGHLHAASHSSATYDMLLIPRTHMLPCSLSGDIPLPCLKAIEICRALCENAASHRTNAVPMRRNRPTLQMAPGTHRRPQSPICLSSALVCVR